MGAGAVNSVIAVLCHYFTDMEYVTLSVAAAVGCLVRNLPVIDWSAVKELPNES